MDTAFSSVACSLSIILTVLMLIMLIQSCRYLLFKKSLTIKGKHRWVTKENKRKTKKKIKEEQLVISFSPYIRFGAISCFIAYFIVDILCIFEMFSFLSTRKRRESRIIPYTMWFFCRIVINSVFVSRLKHSFRGTQWMYSDKIFHLLYGLLSILTVLTITMCVALIIQTQDGWNQNRTFFIISTSVFAIFLDIALTIILTHLFHRRVFQLIQSYYTSFQHMQMQQELQQQQDQHSLLQLSVDFDITANDKTHSTVEMPSIPAYRSDTRTGTNKQQHMKRKTARQKVLFTLVTSHRYPESFAVARDEHDEHDDPMGADDQTNDNKQVVVKAYNHTQLELIRTVTQYTVLIVVSTIASLCSALYAIFRIIWIQKMEPMPYQMNEIFFHIQFSIVIDTFIHGLCLYLHFAFSLNVYKILCHHKLCLHNLCLFYFTKRVQI